MGVFFSLSTHINTFNVSMSFFPAEQMKQKIDSLPLPMGGTDGGLALNEAFNTLFHGKGKFDCILDWLAQN